jgi:hypothetical protein
VVGSLALDGEGSKFTEKSFWFFFWGGVGL